MVVRRRIPTLAALVACAASCSVIFAPSEPFEGDIDACTGVVCEEDAIPCTLMECNPANGRCEPQPMDEACDDENPCNGDETCDTALGCRPGTAPDCDDGVDCTADDCDPARGGCFHEAPDGDGDTYPRVTCPGGTDCDDTDDAVHPGATESCNGADDDCDEATDEGFSCVLGREDTGSCGHCGTQTRACQPGCTWGAWGACTGEGCEPGTTQTQACTCDPGDSEVRICTEACAWGAWSSCAACADVSAVFLRSDFAIDPDQLQIFGVTVVDDVWVHALLDGTEDDTYVQVPVSRTGCPRMAPAAWDIERKRVDERTYRLLVQGVSDRDCGRGQPVSAGEIRVDGAHGWTITDTVRCEAMPDSDANWELIETWCRVDAATGTVSWQAGSQCDSCCSCAEAARVSIEVVVTRS